MRENQSQSAYRQACTLFPGGVNSPVRAFKNVNSTPFFVASAGGAEITDLDGNVFIDYVLSWGPLVAGHAHAVVRTAVARALDHGWSYGAPCQLEIDLALKVRQHFPSIEMMRFVNSGTEAAMGALRLARAVTGRDLIVKCDGGYHGHSDALLVSAGSGLATQGVSSSAGVPAALAATTIVIPINNVDALAEAFARHRDRIAAFILEPVAGNVGVIPPLPGYLQACRDLCRLHGAMLIFDEVMCGFRASTGGATQLYGVHPDITILGKVIGGGFPVGAYGASRALMENIAPCGPVYQAGTLSGNPVAMAAGLATIQLLEAGGHAAALAHADQLVSGMREILSRKKIAGCVQQVGTMFSLFLCAGPVDNVQHSARVDRAQFAAFHRHMLEAGVYMAPSPFESSFTSSAHTRAHAEKTLEALDSAISSLP